MRQGGAVTEGLLMSSLGVMVLAPSWVQGAVRNPATVLSAVRAGAIGILDVERFHDDEAIAQGLAKLLQHAGGGTFGIRFEVGRTEEMLACLQPLKETNNNGRNGNGQAQTEKKYAILTATAAGLQSRTLQRELKALKKLGLLTVVEITTRSEAVAAAEAGADAVIAKGHEAAGRVGDTTTFVLLQQCLRDLSVPVWAMGGIGVHTAAACHAAGAAGVVLDSQLHLCRDCALPESARMKVARMDGTETVLLQGPGNEQFRLYAPGTSVALEHLHEKLKKFDGTTDKVGWYSTLVNFLQSNQNQDGDILILGQDAAFAAQFARKGVTVAGVIDLLRETAQENLQSAVSLESIAENSPLAQSHGTKFPLVQGAMTRVSDNADFARKVAEGGSLPFLALSLMRKAEIDKLLADTQQQLGSMAWGVGILGFVPAQLRAEQLEVIHKYKPPFALIAGGRPDQAKALDDVGIKSYLHVPSPILLKSFVEMGSTRFIFEGKECGGHVGPRSSFLLWEQMISVLLESIGPRDDATQYHILFAGGIHDDLSAAMVAAMAAPLSSRGIKIGLLLGTAYLFTKEAVETGAIVPRFQSEALRCTQTVLLETGPGHSIRCIDSPYKNTFDEHRKSLQENNKNRDDIREELELMNLGRLRIASKGLSREGSDLVQVSDEQQWSEGMYMIGQVAALHDKVLTVQNLHENVCSGGSALLQKRAQHSRQSKINVESHQESIAIVGMACQFPQANDVEKYWQNILDKVDTIEEIPSTHFNWKNYYDADPLAADKIVSKWGGFLKDIVFDPSRYGIPPSSLASIDPMQVLILEVVRAALDDAGYSERKFPREKTSVILANAGHGPITALYSLRSMMGWKLEHLDEAIKKRIEEDLPAWTEDSFPGYLGNVTAGRVANRFDLGGINFSVDAACASSLAALYVGMSDLRSKVSDVVLLAAADTHNQPGDYLSFSKTHALSPGGRCRTFDASADGIVISEGMAILVLKRLSDAERDGDRIYAVIKGIGGSSDGRDLSLTAPRPAGQVQALRRAYADANVSPATVQLVEAHGTGTVAGDRAEVEALTRVYNEAGAAAEACALGSVKTNIGHTKCSAGLASLIKIAKSLHHKVLPPTIGVKEPNPACNFGTSPFYINSELRPWLHSDQQVPRRAAVSAFGFGGTNFHTILEEYVPACSNSDQKLTATWPAELFVWKAADEEELSRALSVCEESIEKIAEELGSVYTSESTSMEGEKFFELARASFLKVSERTAGADKKLSLAIVSTSLADLREKLARTKELLREKSSRSAQRFIKDPRGIFIGETSAEPGKIAFLFPGQGSQRVDMLKDLSLYFSEVRASFEEADITLSGRFEKALSRYVFPVPTFDEAERGKQQEQLTDTRVAQPAIGAADVAALRLLASFNVAPNMVAGHSYGEYVALHAAGVMSSQHLLKVACERGKWLSASKPAEKGAMAAVAADESQLEELLADQNGVYLANVNSPNQCIISGREADIDRVVNVLTSKQITARRIQVSAAFHSPLLQYAVEPMRKVLQAAELKSPGLPVYSNTTARLYPEKVAQLVDLLAKHIVQPVQFAKELQNMYDDGARIFVECGPGTVLTGLAEATLKHSDCLIVPLDKGGRNGLAQLLSLLGQLYVAGVPVKLSRLFAGRFIPVEFVTSTAAKGKLLYRVNSARIQRIEMTKGDSQKSVSKPANKQAPDTATGVTAFQSQPNSSSNRPAANAMPPRSTASAALKPTQTDSNTPARGAQRPGENRLNLNGRANMGTEKVLLEFQQTMLEMTTKFVEAQQNVMLAYLQGAQGNGQSPEQLHAVMQSLTPSFAPPTPIATPQRTAYVDIAEAPEIAGTISTISTNGAEPHASDDVAVESTEPLSKPVSEIDTEGLIASLLDIVSERTGYPVSMLDPTLDLEADLGIDSIKRVEILNNFRKLLPESTQRRLEGSLEQLAGTKTLQAIMDWICTLNDVAEVAVEEQAEVVSNQVVSRGLVRIEPLPAISEAHELSEIILITADSRGVGAAIASELSASGKTALLLTHKSGECQPSSGVIDFTVSDYVSTYLEHVRKSYGVPGTLLHASGLSEDAVADEHVIGLLLLVKHLNALLAATKSAATARIVSITEMGGQFASNGSVQPNAFIAQQAAIVGLTKAVAKELTAARVTAVDLSLGLSVEEAAKSVIAEARCGDDRVEVGTDGVRRVCPDIEDGQLPAGSGEMKLDRSSVVLVTGGARGITADLAIALAKKYKPNMVLIGRSARPEAESSLTAALTTAKEIKAALIDEQRKQGKTPNIAAVEQIYQRLMRDRDMRVALATLEKHASSVKYFSVDVRDKDAFGRLIDSLYETYGNIDGVIHGAGIIEDALIKDKAVESFRRVFETKINSARVLADKLRLDSLKFLFFLSSVVGRTGNAGQSDYCAANEALNKLARKLDGQTKARVGSLMWGPWRAGMAQPELEEVFARYGWAMIERQAGSEAFIKELECGRKGDVEVLLVGKPARKDGPQPAPSIGSNAPKAAAATAPVPVTAAGSLPGVLLGAAQQSSQSPFSALVTINRAQHFYLEDHKFDGIPVLPMAVALELMLEAVQTAYPTYQILRVRNLEIPAGVVFDRDQKQLQVTVNLEKNGTEAPQVSVVLESISISANLRKQNFRCNVDLTDAPYAVPHAVLTCLQANISTRFDPSHTRELEATIPTVGEAYSNWLFHGPIFQGLTDLNALGKNGAHGMVKATAPERCVSNSNNQQWILDPTLFDSAMQIAGIWARYYMDITCLPTGLKKLSFFGEVPKDKALVQVFMPANMEKGELQCDLAIYDQNGRIAVLAEGLSGVGSKSFNRFATQPQTVDIVR
jgi:acyl transferase domain-containing protein/NAD(P)H-dependent flavin oxidoreductase YrpB (nitropropane dioxygenase family)